MMDFQTHLPLFSGIVPISEPPDQGRREAGAGGQIAPGPHLN
jgi:hypothetical protein